MADEKTPSGGDALEAAGGLISSDKLGKIAGKGVAPVATPEKTASAAAAAEPKKVQPRGGDQAAQQAAAAEAAKPDKKVEPITVKTPFGQKTFGVKEDEKGEVTLQSFEDVQTFAKVNNLELKEVNDLQGVIKEHAKLKTELEHLTGLQKQIENYERTLKSLPNEVSLILDSAIKGQDYTQLIQNIANRGALDFSRSFSNYQINDMINHYSDTKRTQDEFKEMDEGQYNALKDLAKTKYETDQASYNAQIQQTKRSTELAQQNFDQSVENSIKLLRTNNPGMGEAEIKRIRDIMTADLQNTLFNGDGYTYKPEAAERIAMQEYGKEAILAQQHTIADIVARYQNQGVSQAREEILEHSDKRPMPAGGSGGADENVISDTVKKETSFMHVRG